MDPKTMELVMDIVTRAKLLVEDFEGSPMRAAAVCYVSGVMISATMNESERRELDSVLDFLEKHMTVRHVTIQGESN